jgi:hypothetical protein
MINNVEVVMTMNQTICTIVLGLGLISPMAAQTEPLGTSCADCPSYKGAYTIENKTHITINYQYRWGDKHPWKDASLGKGMINTHSYPLGEDQNAKVPTPSVRFDRIGGDAVYTADDYRMDFHAVGYGGYGSHKNTTEPKPYYFEFARDGKHLGLYAR